MAKREQKPSRPTAPTLAARVKALGNYSWNEARDLCRTGRVFVNGEAVIDDSIRIAETDVLDVRADAPRKRAGVLDKDSIIFTDRHIAVVSKDAGLLSVPYDANDRDTLVDKLRAALRRQDRRFDPELGVVHRLDKGTSGLLVFARNLAAKRALAQQFRFHTIARTYIAICHGVPQPATYESELIGNRGDGIRGSLGLYRPATPILREGAQRAVTHVQRVFPLRGASLVVVSLQTGRQHQIRIHLSEAGHPLLGENVYVREYLKESRALLPAERPMLHACELGFEHPASSQFQHHWLGPPADFIQTLNDLSGGKAAELLENVEKELLKVARLRPTLREDDDEFVRRTPGPRLSVGKFARVPRKSDHDRDEAAPRTGTGRVMPPTRDKTPPGASTREKSAAAEAAAARPAPVRGKAPVRDKAPSKEKVSKEKPVKASLTQLTKMIRAEDAPKPRHSDDKPKKKKPKPRGTQNKKK